MLAPAEIDYEHHERANYGHCEQSDKNRSIILAKKANDVLPVSFSKPSHNEIADPAPQTQ